MPLFRRLLLLSLATALPAALVIVVTVDALRARDARLALERVARAHLTESVRDACVLDPVWFLAGPRTGRPSLAARQAPDADVTVPRPSADELPFEIFAYDDQFLASSTAGPRFPNEFRTALRGSPPVDEVFGHYAPRAGGTGLQLVLRTGWTPGPCAFLLFRLQPRPGVWTGRVLLFVAMTALVFGLAVAAFLPTVRRIRRLSLEAGASARAGYQTIAPDNGKDEVSAMAFVFNDAATEIHRRGAENADRVEALRRFTTAVEAIAPALADLEAGLSRAAAGGAGDGRLPPLLREAHDAERRLRDLTAASALRVSNDVLPLEPADLAAIVRAVAERYRPLAAGAGVRFDARIPAAPLEVPCHAEFTAQAFGNVIDNAIRYAPAGATVSVVLEPRTDGHVFSLAIANDQPRVPDELFQGLTAVRRFRGDEHWNRRPNGPGLGLAVAREIADRSGFSLELRRPAAGGLEAEFTGGHEPKRG